MATSRLIDVRVQFHWQGATWWTGPIRNLHALETLLDAHEERGIRSFAYDDEGHREIADECFRLAADPRWRVPSGMLYWGERDGRPDAFCVAIVRCPLAPWLPPGGAATDGRGAGATERRRDGETESERRLSPPRLPLSLCPSVPPSFGLSVWRRLVRAADRWLLRVIRRLASRRPRLRVVIGDADECVGK